MRSRAPGRSSRSDRVDRDPVELGDHVALLEPDLLEEAARFDPVHLETHHLPLLELRQHARLREQLARVAHRLLDRLARDGDPALGLADRGLRGAPRRPRALDRGLRPLFIAERELARRAVLGDHHPPPLDPVDGSHVLDLVANPDHECLVLLLVHQRGAGDFGVGGRERAEQGDRKPGLLELLFHRARVALLAMPKLAPPVYKYHRRNRLCLVRRHLVR